MQFALRNNKINEFTLNTDQAAGIFQKLTVWRGGKNNKIAFLCKPDFPCSRRR